MSRKPAASKPAPAVRTANVQKAGVAGHFYPADPGVLTAGVDAALAAANPPRLEAKAVIAPHAGHVFSGHIAAQAYKLLERRRDEIKRVILLGPTHRMGIRGMALSPADAWQTPLGEVAVDKAAYDTAAACEGVSVMDQPFEGEHSLEVHLPFLQRALPGAAVLPVLVGNAPAHEVSAVLKALWGGPETAIIVSSDLSHFHDHATATAKDAETAAGIERLNPAVLEGHRACGHFPIAGLVDQAQKRDLRVTALDVRNSGDTRPEVGRDRVVGYGSFAFEYARSARLADPERRLLFDLARQVVRQAAANGGQAPNLNINGALARPLLAQRATFVTLNIDGRLRGCRGSIIPHRSLVHDVADNAFKSGFGDPRFPPITAAELEALTFHVSILSTPRRIHAASEAELLASLHPDVDGLIIREGQQQALFLPHVWGQLPDPRQFLAHLHAKAGLPQGHWSDTFQAFRFTTESFGEEDFQG
jgi:AmmeMemoRadiSam system protein B/AmmeMemoRadiSam system protein A